VKQMEAGRPAKEIVRELVLSCLFETV
jgi:hypothetical protein